MFNCVLSNKSLWLKSSDDVATLVRLVHASEEEKADERNTGDDFKPVDIVIG